jgi:16S rRNA (guanine1207-N2)-methyltransferase
MSEHYFSEEPEVAHRKGLIKTILRGHDLEFITSTGIFSYRRIDKGTRILIESMEVPQGGRLLDMGCGYGPIGITAYKVNPDLEIWMVDINRRAVELSRENVERNNVKATVVQSHLYESIENLHFDSIVSNPPVSAGMRKAVEPIIEGATKHLVKGGNLQTVMQYNKGGRTLESLMEQYFGNVTVLDKKSGYRVFKSINQ